MSISLVKPTCFGLLNIAAASGIVFANKLVLSTLGFHFLSALALIHTVATVLGMHLFCWVGVFESKRLPLQSTLPLAIAFVGYIVLNNLNLRLNTVSFYQVTKIAVGPAVLGAEAVFFGKRASKQVVASLIVVCIGIAISTVSDFRLGDSSLGWLVGAGAVAATAAYQIWAGTKQTELSASSFQLLHQYSPVAACLLSVLVLVMEPLGFKSRSQGTLLGYQYTPASIIAIAISSVLGLLVSLSTFLVIGATSSLTYNVVGHIKTVIILMGGCAFFGDEMPLQKLAGITLAMLGIIWYSQLKLAAAAAAARAGAPAQGASTPKALKAADLEAQPLLRGSPASKLRREHSRDKPASLGPLPGRSFSLDLDAGPASAQVPAPLASPGIAQQPVTP